MLNKGDIVDAEQIRSPYLRVSEGKIIQATMLETKEIKEVVSSSESEEEPEDITDASGSSEISAGNDIKIPKLKFN